MHLPTLLLLLALVGCRGPGGAGPKDGVGPDTGQPTDTGTPPPWAWAPLGQVPGVVTRALVQTERGLLAASHGGLSRSEDGGRTWHAVDPTGLPEGEVVFLGPAGGDALVGFVWGAGLVRSGDGGQTWAPAARPPVQPELLALQPRARVVPQATAVAEDGTVWMAAIGGVFTSADAGDTWVLRDLGGSGGPLDVLFTGVSVSGDEIVVVSQQAEALLPGAGMGPAAATVARSIDGGARWEERGAGLAARAPMAVAHGDAALCVATLDAGVACSPDGGDTWAALPGGPPDAVALAALPGGAWGVGTASRGAWAWDGAGWTQAGAAPIAALAGRHAVDTEGQVRVLEPGAGSPAPPDAGGRVHIALSVHARFARSHQADGGGGDGHGPDIALLRAGLDWLDDHPDAHADWAIEAHATLEGGLPDDAPDVLARIQDRVAGGRDAARPTSGTGGAVAQHTPSELDADLAWALDAHQAAFDATHDGVHPEAGMFSPGHLAAYAAQGVSWITLPAGASGRSALRAVVGPTGSDPQGAPGTLPPRHLEDPDTGGALIWVPTWGLEDVLDHGGLAAWATQLARSTPGDTLLVLHAESDGPAWAAFGAELDALAPLTAAGRVGFTTISAHLADHPPAETVPLRGDGAGGMGGSFAAWAEKDTNHRLATSIATARTRAAAAALLGAGDPAVEDAVDAAVAPRLRALSAGHFGPAPALHGDRLAEAWAEAGEALATADAALALAESGSPVPAGTLHLVNPRPSAGPVPVDVTIEIPAAAWTRVDDLVLRDASGAALPFVPRSRSVWPDHVRQTLGVVVEVAAEGVTEVTWAMEPGATPAGGGLAAPDAPALDRLGPPTTACNGAEAVAVAGTALPPTADPHGAMAEQASLWSLPLCDAWGDVAVRQTRWAGLPGVVVTVDARMGAASDPAEAESVALTPLACLGRAATLSWRDPAGRHRTRPLPPSTAGWNGSAADGQLTLRCDDGRDLQVAHRVGVRTAMAFAPIRDRGGQTRVAPLGTLWSEPPWPDGRGSGGSGIGAIVAGILDPHHRPAAADWSGQDIHYQLLVGEDLSSGVLDLFAHPPLVRAARPPAP